MLYVHFFRRKTSHLDEHHFFSLSSVETKQPLCHHSVDPKKKVPPRKLTWLGWKPPPFEDVPIEVWGFSRQSRSFSQGVTHGKNPAARPVSRPKRSQKKGGQLEIRPASKPVGDGSLSP